jgi:hypothetical protein
LLIVDAKLLELLIVSHQKESLSYVLHIDDKTYSLMDVTILTSSTPVSVPTIRGGVFFSDTFAYKIKGTVHDVSILPRLSKVMLGPNTEFGEIKITTTIKTESKKINLSLITNLTNSVQSPNKIELNMILINLKLL